MKEVCGSQRVQPGTLLAEGVAVVRTVFDIERFRYCFDSLHTGDAKGRENRKRAARLQIAWHVHRRLSGVRIAAPLPLQRSGVLAVLRSSRLAPMANDEHVATFSLARVV